MRRTNDRKITIFDFDPRIEDSPRHELERGHIMKISSGSGDFFRDIREIMDAVGRMQHEAIPPSTFLERLQLHKIPLIAHDDQGLIEPAIFMKNAKGVAYKFQVGILNGLSVYASLLLKKRTLDHKPRLYFYTVRGIARTETVMRQTALIEPLRAASLSAICLAMVTQVALIGNGAIEGRRFVFSIENIKELNRLCIGLPSLSRSLQKAPGTTIQEPGPIKTLTEEAPASSHGREGLIREESSNLDIRPPEHSESINPFVPTPRSIKKSYSRESSLSVLSSTSHDAEMGQYISDPSEFLSMDAAIREDERSGHQEVQKANDKLMRLSQKKAMIERSMAKANNKKRVGQDKIQKAERWRKDSMTRLAPSLRAFWEAASKAAKDSDAS